LYLKLEESFLHVPSFYPFDTQVVRNGVIIGAMVSRTMKIWMEVAQLNYYLLIIHLLMSQDISWYSNGLQAGWPNSVSQQGQEIFLYCTASGPALRLTKPRIHWVLGVKQLGCEADHTSL
jgi:hypothetical protein